MKLRRHARVWRWFAVMVFVGISVWRWSPASFANRQTTTKPRVVAGDFGQWSFIGPPNYLNSGFSGSFWTGRVTAVAVDPADPNHWLIGAAQGGVWDSHDAGATWQPRTDGQPSLAIGAIAFSPTSPNVVYAGTGEANYMGWTYAGAGMLRSDDSGATWSVVNTTTFARASVRGILVHPADLNIVVAGTARGGAGRDLDFPTSAPIYGIQRSTDGGRTWTLLLRGEVSELVRHPADFSRQYAAIGAPAGLTGVPSGAVPGPMPNGLYRTADTGDHWTPVAGPWTALAGGSGYIALAVSPSNPDVMYASVQSPCCTPVPQYLLGLFRTNNAWAATPEWIQIPFDGVNEGYPNPGYCDGGECAYQHVISVDPADSETIFAGGENLWRCASCGTRPTWSLVAHKIVNIGVQTQFGDPQNVHSDHQALTWIGNRLIDANDGGVWSSIDRGATWRNHNRGLPLFQMYSGAVHPTGDLILANTQDASLAIKRTSAGEWEAASGGAWEGNVIISSTRPDTDWAGTSNNRRVTRTTDGGRSFQALQAGFDLTGAHLLMPLEKCPGNDDVVLVGTNRLWRTNNFFSAAAPSWSVNADLGRILTVAFAGSDSSCSTYAFGTVGAGTVSVGFGTAGAGSLRITRNGGASWSDFDPSDGVPNRAVTGIAFAASDLNVAYVTLSGLDEGTPGKPGHVFKSTNALAASPAWTNVTPPVNLPFNTVAIDPATSSTVYVGADNGVWASRDAGATWAYMGPDSGLPNTAVFDLQIQASTRKVFAFTFGRGAFVLTPSP